ncbi:MAG: fimbrial assembly protein [Candidatus Dactylopiibacterium carminicum]|uniref:Fimbrial assembly protein n=1 Tax=Candidatus Dactylopiibacterium carminicum TaxID=857335 RepID=A0A272ENU1_9RHOO|nr:type IV pilin protein [Candidatus Dactylopiibacterium carminicum]KAF7599151.1 fimbrial assembly protein [Candidatus Dactylopiibacterium carminicum]PAS91696.1 MAG: fimbrial assembly protein [Candidatus Dactylopiibacterium carminicum]PAS93762.1 MAG: fimbrial assembly protein [Candidatus Dactylopiibacterium carminicum]PAS99138.1 MAG: fimbrial assembly protein [Candidatus Dactylopiibacterium carminicum]
MPTARQNLLNTAGFTLIELMITVAIIGILASIAYPSYRDYVTRSRLVDATNALSTLRAQMEQHFQDNRTYQTVGSFTTPCSNSANQTAGTFAITCNVTNTTYTITATGSGQTNGFTYTINQSGTQATTAIPSDWGSAANGCWIQRKGQTC